ncbi:alpha/beta hydrolase [Sandarakinorhabdus sp.]|uniref:alpha/beta fold hydrolase n=1 Tax=Sandarakinorhabdus sp. TaxID=1916663 RepID=UPI00286DCA24|nr:alpha/beta hydrolase [Sandarakinorhabdus sp.]
MQRTRIETAVGTMSALVWDEAGPDALNLHFAHATGMNAQLYARLLAPLAGQFRIIASDARGHGHSPLPADPALLTSWDDFADDLDHLLTALDRGASGGRPWLMAGHSMGAAVSLLAAARRPSQIAGLVLADPAMLPFDVAAQVRAGAVIPNPMADQAVRRRGMFSSRADARAAYAGRGVFARWTDEDLDAYLDGGMIDTADGAALACTPAFESATFRAVSPHVESALAAVAAPLALLAGEHGSTVRDAELAVFAAHPHCRMAHRLPGTSHFLPLEEPDAVRAAIIAVGG